MYESIIIKINNSSIFFEGIIIKNTKKKKKKKKKKRFLFLFLIL